MSKRVLLIGGNFSPEPTGIGKYNGEMIDWLSSQGFSCTVITTFPYYPFWRIQAPYTKSHFWFKKESRINGTGSLPINIIRAPHYVPQDPSGVKRIFSDFTFFFSSFLIIVKLLFNKKHDYITTVAPPFQLGLLGVLYKKIKGAKFLYHIQDLQIDAAKELNMIRSSLLIKTLFSLEKYILNNADFISTISLGMIKKVEIKCNKDIFLFPNWVDTEQFLPVPEKGKLKEVFGFNSNDKIVLYSGAIGEKQGLESIIYSAKALKDFHYIKFVICGSGPYKEKLQLLKKNFDLKNVIFYPLQPMRKFNDFLNIGDIHLVLQKKSASDLVMPSKLTTILSVGGLAIVTASPGTCLHDIISKDNIGILIEPENQDALNNAIKTAALNNNSKIERNARMYAEIHLSINQILSRYLKAVFKNEILNRKNIVKEMTPSLSDK